MSNFIITNWITIAIALLVLFYIGYLIYTNQWSKLRADAYALMLRVEGIYADNEGEKKMARVLLIIYSQLPIWLKYFVTFESLREILQEWYNYAKEELWQSVQSDSIK